MFVCGRVCVCAFFRYNYSTLFVNSSVFCVNRESQYCYHITLMCTVCCYSCCCQETMHVCVNTLNCGLLLWQSLFAVVGLFSLAVIIFKLSVKGIQPTEILA